MDDRAAKGHSYDRRACATGMMDAEERRKRNTRLILEMVSAYRFCNASELRSELSEWV